MATGFEIIRTSSLILTGHATYFKGFLERHQPIEVPEEYITKKEQEKEMSQLLEALLIAGGVYIQLTRGLFQKDANNQERDTVIMRIIVNIDNFLRATNRFYSMNWPQQPWVNLLGKFYRYSESLGYSFNRQGTPTNIQNLDIIFHYLYHAPGEKELESFSKLPRGYYETHKLFNVSELIRNVFEYQRDNINIPR